jgi:hypothetical protein
MSISRKVGMLELSAFSETRPSHEQRYCCTASRIIIPEVVVFYRRIMIGDPFGRNWPDFRHVLLFHHDARHTNLHKDTRH